MNVVGIDFSTKAIDLVKIGEGLPEWYHRTLPKARGIDQAMGAVKALPGDSAAFWADVILIAIEEPRSWNLKALAPLMRIQGALAVSVPARIGLWELPPELWKKECGLAGNAKIDGEAALEFVAIHSGIAATFNDDGRAAFCIAYAAKRIMDRTAAA